MLDTCGRRSFSKASRRREASSFNKPRMSSSAISPLDHNRQIECFIPYGETFRLVRKLESQEAKGRNFMDPKFAAMFVLFAIGFVVFPTLVLRYRRLRTCGTRKR